jgi:WD40 repeat protein
VARPIPSPHSRPLLPTAPSLHLLHDTAPRRDRADAHHPTQRLTAFASRPNLAVTAENRGTIRAFNLPDWSLRWERALPADVPALAIDPTGSFVATGCRDQVTLMRASDGATIRERVVPSGVLAVSVDAAGQMVAGSGSASTWVDLGDDWGALTTHAGRVGAVDRAGSIVATGAADAQVAWIDLDEGRAHLFQGHVHEVLSVKLLPDDRVLSTDAGGTVRLWQGPSGRLLHTLRATDGALQAATVTDGQVVAVGADRVLWCWDRETGEPQGLLEGHVRPILGIGTGPDGSVLTAGGDRSVRAWTPTDATPPRPFSKHRDGVRACLVLGDRAWTGSRDGTIRLWDIPNGTEVSAYTLGHGPVQSLAWMPRGRLCVGAIDGSLTAIEADGSVVWTRKPAHKGPVTCLTWLPDPGLVLSGGADGVLRAWDPKSGMPVMARPDHASRVRSLASGPDGLAATGGYDGTLLIVSPLAGSALSRVTAHDGPITGCTWAGERLVSVGLDGTLRTWNRQGEAEASVEAHPSGGMGVAAVDADHVISIGRDGSLSLWNLHIFGDGESARLATLDLGEALDGVHVHGDTAVVGDRRGGVHAVTIRS